MTEEQDLDELEGPSKSQVKRDMLALQALGERLVELPQKMFTSMELPEELRDAVATARSISSHGARKRQIKYIGRILRSIDSEEIDSQLQRYKNSQRQASEHHHKLEQLREKLISGGDEALTEFLEDYSAADRKSLRQLIRNARKEQEQNKPEKSFRVLFRVIREIIEAAG